MRVSTPATDARARSLALGDDPASRAAAYRALLLEPLTINRLSSIRDHMRQERALGCPRFQAMVEKTIGLRAGRDTGMAVDAGRMRSPPPYLKFQVSQMVCEATGGPCTYTGKLLGATFASATLAQEPAQKSLYDRLGGLKGITNFRIAVQRIVGHQSVDEIVQ